MVTPIRKAEIDNQTYIIDELYVNITSCVLCRLINIESIVPYDGCYFSLIFKPVFVPSALKTTYHRSANSGDIITTARPQALWKHVDLIELAKMRLELDNFIIDEATRRGMKREERS